MKVSEIEFNNNILACPYCKSTKDHLIVDKRWVKIKLLTGNTTNMVIFIVVMMEPIKLAIHNVCTQYSLSLHLTYPFEQVQHQM